MPGAEIAQYGIGFFALVVLAYTLVQTQRNRRNQHNHNNTDRFIMVVENNTRALENNTKAIEQLLIIATRQEAKIDELLAKARRE